MRDDQPYYYFDGYKMGQEEKKTKEHQGHHCSGKCTKFSDELIKMGKEVLNKEKECEHDWDKHPIIPLCKKCDLPRAAQFKKEQDPFWLKVNDTIIDTKLNVRLKVLAISEYWVTVSCEGQIFEYKKEEANSTTFKKIKLVSPAVYKNRSGYHQPTEEWFPKNPNIIIAEGRLTSEFTWPAKDQFGRELWFEVEE